MNLFRGGRRMQEDIPTTNREESSIHGSCVFQKSSFGVVLEDEQNYKDGHLTTSSQLALSYNINFLILSPQHDSKPSCHTSTFILSSFYTIPYGYHYHPRPQWPVSSQRCRQRARPKSRLGAHLWSNKAPQNAQ